LAARFEALAEDIAKRAEPQLAERARLAAGVARAAAGKRSPIDAAREAQARLSELTGRKK